MKAVIQVPVSQLAARVEPFDSFWEAPEDIEKGYRTFGEFYRRNYLKYVPEDRNSNILVISCGPGYFLEVLREAGYGKTLGIDSSSEKLKYAFARGLNCRHEEAFPFLQNTHDKYDLILCEQEVNHLTKSEILIFLGLCREKLATGGKLIVHSLNGANPITGAESLALNFDHFNTLTEYSLRQILEHAHFQAIHIIPLNLYVFYRNPINYIGLAATGLMSLFFRLTFILYGKKNRIFTKKIAAVATK